MRIANVLVILTTWPEFPEPDLTKGKELLARPRVVDDRNLLDPIAVKAEGFARGSIGRPW